MTTTEGEGPAATVPSPYTAERIEDLRRRTVIARADELMRHDHVTDLQIERGRDELPGWAREHVPLILSFTFRRYAGVDRRSKSHVFVIDGEVYDGVYPAAEPWLEGIDNGFRDKVREKGLAHSTVATYLGRVCRALLGGRTVSRYSREGTGEDEELDMFEDGAPAPPTDGPASSHPIAPDDAVPVDDVDAGPPRVSLRCPGCDVEHGDWEIRRTDGGQFLIARCGRCEGESAFRFHAFMSDGFPA